MNRETTRGFLITKKTMKREEKKEREREEKAIGIFPSDHSQKPTILQIRRFLSFLELPRVLIKLKEMYYNIDL